MNRKVRKSIDEQETIINIDPPQLGNTTYVYSTIPATYNKLWKLHKKYPELVEVVADDQWGSEFKVPRDWIVIKPKRVLSDEQKAKLKERLNQKKSK